MAESGSYDRTRTLLAAADRVFKARKYAWRWCMNEHQCLGGETPWSLAIQSQDGLEKALAELHKGEHGIPV